MSLPPEILLLQTCNSLQEVRQLHAQLVVSGLIRHRPIAPRRLLQAYVSTSHLSPAISILQTSITSPDVFLYNTIIRGFLTHRDSPTCALLFYNRLLLHGLLPDIYTYTFVLKACSRLRSLPLGKQLHARIIKAGLPPHAYVHTSLIHMYATSGSLDDAECLLREFDWENVDATNAIISGYCSRGRVLEARAKFDGLGGKDVVSWSAMITGYARNGMHSEALSLFQSMMTTVADPKPNESMLLTVLTACGCLGALAQGRWIHEYVNRVGIEMTTTLSTALIDMYAKSGSVDCSYHVFRNLGSRDRDVVSWGAMIYGFAIHGQAAKCLQLFDEMIGDGIRPSVVIFVAVLSACSHSGLVDIGQRYFHDMVHRFGITPSIEHYGCMVDMLARVGRLAEAEQLIKSMPEQANSVVLRAFLSGCSMHNDIRRGSWAFQRLIEVEPKSGDRHKMGELMFASAGRKEEATKIRRLMRETEMETTAGCSFIQVDGHVHEFVAGDIMHCKTEEIYRMCNDINRAMRRTQ